MSISERRIIPYSSGTTYGIIERFIPKTALPSAYQSNSRLVRAEPVGRNSHLSLREDMFFASFNYRPLSSLDAHFDNMPTNSESNNEEKSTSKLQNNIADALGYNSHRKVLGFQSSSKSKDSKRTTNSSCSSLEIAGPLLSSTPTKDIIRLLANDSNSPLRNRMPVPKPTKTLIASSILQAPGLRNDFYSNLVSWSKKGNRIAVGLGLNTYLWGIDNDVKAVMYDECDVVTSVIFSDGDELLIATAHGRLLLINQFENQVKATFSNSGKCIYCLQWIPKTKIFFAGDEFGEVMILEVVQRRSSSSIRLRSKFKCHSQQICGIALNSDCSQVAVGANDNSCSIWDIRNVFSPKLKFVLPHTAAVKAIAFCPWTNSLLATGGGSRDRTIRFWHTKSGTLLHSHSTNGQITSLIWSRYKKELVATFGFSDGESPSLIRAYSYPKMIVLVDVPATSNLRILSSTISPDYSSICVATNDSTIRIYKLWEKSHKIVSSPEFQGIGTYGSSLIELQEGIDRKGDTIR